MRTNLRLTAFTLLTEVFSGYLERRPAVGWMP
jgi:hypothetical protein